MTVYLIRRLAMIIPTLFIISLLLFLMIRLMPGSVVELMAAEHFTEAGTPYTTEAIEKMLGLDKPFFVQYGEWIWGILHGDFGKSFWTDRTMIEEIKVRLPVTFELSLFSMVVGILFAVPIGIFAAMRQDSVMDYILRSIAIAFLALPTFWIATMVIVYPSIWWGWMPNVEYVPITENFLANIGQFMLPSVIMGLSTSGGLVRITRTMMLEVLRQDYIRTAWAKGLRERAVVLRHAIKNTLIPVVTIIGAMVPTLLSGSVIIEQIFALPGMGRYFLEAVQSRDYLIVSSWNLIMSITVLTVIVLTDISYAIVDPRIRYK